MKIETRESNGVRIVAPQGKITIGTGDVQLRETIGNLIRDGATKIVVNLGNVSTIDSTGVGELVGCYTTVKNKGGALKLSNLTDKVSDLLTVTQLITVFEIFPTEQDAVASF